MSFSVGLAAAPQRREAALHSALSLSPQLQAPSPPLAPLLSLLMNVSPDLLSSLLQFNLGALAGSRSLSIFPSTCFVGLSEVEVLRRAGCVTPSDARSTRAERQVHLCQYSRQLPSSCFQVGLCVSNMATASSLQTTKQHLRSETSHFK